MLRKNLISYTGKDFNTISNDLKAFIKAYYPNTYSDFNPASPGMMLLDLIAVVGDTLSVYIDKTFKDLLITETKNRRQLLLLAQALGYKPRSTTVATTNLDVFIVVPAILNLGQWIPDLNYALNIAPGLEVQNSEDSNVIFRTSDIITWTGSNVVSKVYSNDGTNPTYFLLQQTVKVHSATVTTETFILPEEPKKYYKLQLSRTDIIEILSVKDSQNNLWSEADVLAQDIQFVDEINTDSEDRKNSPYLLRLQHIPKRFITRLNEDGKLELQFGSGISTSPDEWIIPNPSNVGSALTTGITSLDSDLDPSNFLYTKTYGQVPYNTSLTVTYTYGGGIKSNVSQGKLIKISNVEWYEPENLIAGYVNDVKKSLAVYNEQAAVGGRGPETLEEIRENAIAHFASQKRTVTKEDYIMRTYCLPSKYGTIAKAHVSSDTQLTEENITIENPLALNLYVLSYDENGHLTTTGETTKKNLKTYISQYRILTDGINILNAYIINIAVKFEIITFTTLNKNEVLLNCIEELKKYFSINNWQINQPIKLSELFNLLIRVQGVQNVTKLEIFNKWSVDDGYSGNLYDISAATKDGIIYSSLDPAIFELKYPNNDIIGRAL